MLSPSPSSGLPTRLAALLFAVVAACAVALASPSSARAAPPGNDDFASATSIAGLPFVDDVDVSEATTEPGEPFGCFFLSQSVWYELTPDETGFVEVSLAESPFGAFVTVWRTFAPGLGGLSFVGCSASFWSPPTVSFMAQAGTTYYVQAGRQFSDGGLRLSVARVPTPAPVASFGHSPFDASIFDTVQLFDGSFDPAGVGIESRAWDLGDGATSSSCCPSHRYAADGVYTVTLTVTTFDGRTATASRDVRIETHDVAVVRLQAPTAASSGQTREIGVELKNARYPERVEVHLLKSIPGFGGFEFVGVQVVSVPARASNRTTPVAFSYTFTADDAAVGKVTFKAIARIVGARDALPADNEAVASPTKVAR